MRPDASAAKNMDGLFPGERRCLKCTRRGFGGGDYPKGEPLHRGGLVHRIADTGLLLCEMPERVRHASHFCACGCGQRPRGWTAEYVRGHRPKS